jgi:hypothetical protein
VARWKQQLNDERRSGDRVNGKLRDWQSGSMGEKRGCGRIDRTDLLFRIVESFGIAVEIEHTNRKLCGQDRRMRPRKLGYRPAR